MAVEYRVLGPLEALVDGQRAALGPPRHRALLVLLLAQANHVVPSTRLIDELWGEVPAPSAANILQGAISQLRKTLGKEAIETRGTGYAVMVDSNRLDVHAFEQTLRAGACWHPIVGGSGAFAGARGAFQMLDAPTATGVETCYVGRIRMGGGAAAGASRFVCG